MTKKTCKACGESLESFQTKCPTCGTEISKTDGNSKLAELELKINEVRKAYEDKISKATGAREKVLVEGERDKEIESIISNFTIPTDKENLLEFLAHCEGQQQNIGFAQAYRVKLNECISKLEIMAITDPSLNVVLLQYEKRKIKGNRTLIVVAVSVVFFLLIMLIGIALFDRMIHH